MADWLPELDDDDIATLVDALEAWEQKDLSGEIFSDILDTVMTSKEQRVADDYKRARRDERQTRERDRAVRKERSVMLRAKLLTLRNRRRVERLTANAVPDVDCR
jgi:hypothetical protein